MIINKVKNTSFSFKTKLFTYFSLLVFAVILMISTIYYVNLKNSMRKNIIDANISMITQLKNSTENTIKDVNYSLLKVVSDPSVENFMLLYLNRDKYIVEVMEFLERMNSKITYSKHYSACYLYYEKEKIVVDISLGRIFNKNNMTSIGSDRQYLENNSEIIDKVVGSPELTANSRSEMKIFNLDTKHKSNVITFVDPIGSYNSSSRIFLFITIDHEYFDELLDSIKSNEYSNVYIVDKYYKAVSTNNKFHSYMQNIKANELEIFNNQVEGSFTGNIDNEENLISFVCSEKFGWKFIYTIPTSVVFKSLNLMKLQIVVILFICLILGIFISFVSAGKIYVPIKGLINTINEYSNESLDSNNNDISFIESSVKKLISRNRGMEEILEDSLPVLRNSVLNKLLLNEVSIEDDVWRKLDFYKANVYPDMYYVVFVIGIDKYKEYAAKYNEKQIDMMEIYQIEIIKDICMDSELISIQNVKMNQNELVLLASLNFPDKEKAKAGLFEFIKKAQTTITKNMKYTATIGIGTIYGSIAEVYKSFSEARSAYGYKIIKGNNSIITIDDVPRMQDWYYIYPFDIEKTIFIRLKEGDQSVLLETLNKYFECLQSYKINVSEIKYAYIYLLDNTIKCCVEMALNVNNVFSGKENLYKDLLDQNTISDIHSWFKELYIEIMDYISIKKNSKSEEIVFKIIEYIDNNFMSSDISMELLSEQLHYSESYLGKLFKYTINKSVKKYITEKRIEKARGLLKESGMRIKDIGEKVGYPNTQSFIKIFKKYYGETPGEYHDRHFKKVLT